MNTPVIEVGIAPELALFLPARRRSARLSVACDGTSSLGHIVQSLGVPLPEVGFLIVNGARAEPSYRPVGGEQVLVKPVTRPQRLARPRFLLDVHLGALARRMRLVGLDAAYSNDRDDDELVDLANAEQRVLLPTDRGLLQRGRLRLGAYVRGDRPGEQLRDVLGRFAPPLAPWTRCTACNGLLSPVPKPDVEELLLPGTRRSYQEFSRCRDCGRVYWRGAHSRRLAAIVAEATEPASPASPASPWGSADPGAGGQAGR